jgi:hypothetical protein
MKPDWLSVSGLRETLDSEVTTKVKHLVGTGLVALAVVVAGIWGLQRNSNADRAADRRDQQEADYFDARRVYDTQVVQRQQCVDRVQTRVEVRAIMIGFNETDIGQNMTLRGILEDIDGQSPEPPTGLLATALALVQAQDVKIEAQRVRIDTEYELLDVADCPPMPVEPQLPESLLHTARPTDDI